MQTFLTENRGGGTSPRKWRRTRPIGGARWTNGPRGMRGMRSVSGSENAFQKGCKTKRKILVQLDVHRMCGTAGTGKSSSAEAAANAMAA
jgi:hypothetical protein